MHSNRRCDQQITVARWLDAISGADVCANAGRRNQWEKKTPHMGRQVLTKGAVVHSTCKCMQLKITTTERCGQDSRTDLRFDYQKERGMLPDWDGSTLVLTPVLTPMPTLVSTPVLTLSDGG